MFYRHDNGRLTQENVKHLNKLQEQIGTLETTLATKESELLQERQIKEDLFHQASAVAQSQDSERKIQFYIIYHFLHYFIFRKN